MKPTNTPSLQLRNSINRSLWRRGVFLLSVALVCFGLSPAVEAVSPPPDGGYPGGNTAEGTAALRDLTTGESNTALGNFTLTLNTGGDSNTGVGDSTLRNNTTGSDNTAVGVKALTLNSTGDHNTAVGLSALFGNTIGMFNTAIGSGALSSNTTGGGNTAIGDVALRNCRTGIGNTTVGFNAGANVTTADHVICIGESLAGANVDNTTWIDNIFGARTQSAITAPVVVSNTGQLGTVASSERFKKDIATMNQASEAILSPRPVTFHYKMDTQGTPQFGLIAEEVAKVNPALVLPDKEGKPYTVRYDQVNAMLLNEFLKEHKAFVEEHHIMEKLQVTVAQQQSQIEALTAGLQKVSARLEVSKAEPQTAVNNH